MHAFYINLRSRTDRRSYMERQAAARGLTIERVEAVTPADIAAEALKAAARWLSPGELACTFSHRAVWRLMLERGLPAALVLEDDCVLSTGIAQFLNDPKVLEPGIALMQLETHPSTAILGRPLPTTVDGVFKRRMISSSLGSCAYIITAELARRCLAEPEFNRIEMGKCLFGRDGPLLYTERVFQAFPAIATPLDALLRNAGEGAANSDLNAARAGSTGRVRRRDPWRRLRKLSTTARHVSRAIDVFGFSALIEARQHSIPFAGDAGLAEALLREGRSKPMPGIGEIADAPPATSG